MPRAPFQGGVSSAFHPSVELAVDSQNPGLKSKGIEVLLAVHARLFNMINSEQVKTPVVPGFYCPWTGELFIEPTVALCEG